VPKKAARMIGNAVEGQGKGVFGPARFFETPEVGLPVGISTCNPFPPC
jgi:hypothetical protein